MISFIFSFTFLPYPPTNSINFNFSEHFIKEEKPIFYKITGLLVLSD